jgi:hypothetical protein
MRSRSERCPDDLVEMVIHLAETGGGHVLGMPFDVQAARATLTYVSDARAAVDVARQLVQKLEDDLVQARSRVTDPTFALYTALRRLVNTDAGNKLAPAYEQMKSMVRNRPRRPSGRKAGATSAQPVAPKAPSNDGASVKP